MTINSAMPADVAEKQFDGGGDCDEQERDAAIQSIVDDVLDGNGIKAYRRQWTFCDFVTPESVYQDDLETLILCDEEGRYNVVKRLKERCANDVRDWCDNDAYGLLVLQDRITQLRESARESAGN